MMGSLYTPTTFPAYSIFSRSTFSFRGRVSVANILPCVSHSPYAAHLHPPLDMRVGPNAPPGALPADLPGAFEGMSVEQMNELGIAKRQIVRDRLEAESRGHESIFSQ
jgi:hypothetical protein